LKCQSDCQKITFVALFFDHPVFYAVVTTSCYSSYSMKIPNIQYTGNNCRDKEPGNITNILSG
jgi:hypothetical protein